MDESALQTRLSRIERLQYLVLTLLVAQVLLDIASVLGGWTTGVLVAVLGVVAFAGVSISRRRSRAAGETDG